jgi:hypothetical protein
MMFFKKDKIKFYCNLPEVLEQYPIAKAKSHRFEWFKNSAAAYKKIAAERGTFQKISGTVKCFGLQNIMQSGYILRSWFDLTINTGTDPSQFEFSIPEGIDFYLKARGFDRKLVAWFSGNESALTVPTPANSLKTLIKIATPWTVSIPKGYRLLMMPIPYPDEPEFSATHGIMEPGEFYDINAIIQVHKRPGQLFIPAGTPLCQMIVLRDEELEVELLAQDHANTEADIANRFKNGHSFITKYK